MINQVKDQINQRYPIVSLESGGMIGVVASTPPVVSTALQPSQGNLTAFACLGLGAFLGAIGSSILISGEIAKVQANAKMQVSKAQDVAAIAQWNSLNKQKQIDDFCLKNGSQINDRKQ